MSSLLSKRLDRIEPLVNAAAGSLEPTVFGVIDRVDKIDGKLVPNIIRRWRGTIGNMEPTNDDPTVLLVAKLEPLILQYKSTSACMVVEEA